MSVNFLSGLVVVASALHTSGSTSDITHILQENLSSSKTCSINLTRTIRRTHLFTEAEAERIISRIALASCLKLSNVLTLYLQLSLYCWTLTFIILLSACSGSHHNLLVCSKAERLRLTFLKLSGKTSGTLDINSHLCPTFPLYSGLLSGQRRFL